MPKNSTYIPATKKSVNHTSNQEQTLVEVKQMYKGMLPHPQTMQGFKEIDPSFPERIMKMAEDTLKLTLGNKIECH